jgi:hypothetical protein
MSDIHEQGYGLRMFYRDPLFDRALAELRAQGGYAAVAADKAEELIGILTGTNPAGGRHRFRFTRNGEYRIKHCRKVDLGCGYRIVCIQKDQRLVMLYIGTHDDCFRWIERRRTAEYDLDSVAESAWIQARAALPGEPALRKKVSDEDRFAEAYEASLMDQFDEAVLRKVFSGLAERR